MADEQNTGADASMSEMLNAMNVQLEELKAEPPEGDAETADSSGARDEGTGGEGETGETGEAAATGEGETGETGEADTPDPLVARLEALEAKLNEANETIAKLTEKPAEPPAPPEPPPPAEWESMEFVGDDFDIDNLTKDTFNTMLNTVAAKVYSIARNAAATDALLKVPDIVRNNVNIHLDLRKAIDKFYDANADLKEHNKVVMAEAEKIAAAEPALSVDELFTKAGVAARTTLKLAAKAQPKAETRTGRGLTNVHNQPPPPASDTLSKFEKEVDAMMKAVNPQ